MAKKRGCGIKILYTIIAILIAIAIILIIAKKHKENKPIIIQEIIVKNEQMINI